MSADLEDRLRDMYVAVASATVVEDDSVVATVSITPSARRSRRHAAVLVAAAIIVVAVLGFLVARRGDRQPAAPMDGRPFAIPMWLPDDMGLDGTALAGVNDVGDAFSPPTRALTASLKYVGANERIVFINSFDAKGVSANPTGATVQLGDGTVAQWDDGFLPRLVWTLPTGQGVSVTSAGPEVTKEELTDIASSLWYVDRATWDAVTAKVGYTSGVFQTWRIPGAGTGVDLTITGSLRAGLRLLTGSFGMGYQARSQKCSASAPNVDDAVVYVAHAPASAVLATGPDGELVQVPLTMAPGLPMFRWGAVSYPGASEQWLNATDHSAGCTAVAP